MSRAMVVFIDVATVRNYSITRARLTFQTDFYRSSIYQIRSSRITHKQLVDLRFMLFKKNLKEVCFEGVGEIEQFFEMN